MEADSYLYQSQGLPAHITILISIILRALMKRTFVIVMMLVWPFSSWSQENAKDPGVPKWKFSAWAEVFILPGEQDFFNPTFYARTEKLHLEARYNYEDRNTVSLWAGRRFHFGESVKFVVVPMAGLVAGNTNGMSPGLELEITYKKFDFYSESENVFDFNNKENNFFYQYGEVAIRPIQPIRTGLVVQRTRLFQSERELQRGFFGEYYRGPFRAGLFWFSPLDESHYWIASVSLDF
jgi:hypothetical protein